VRQPLHDAYAAADADRARTMLTNLVRRLRDDHPGAAASLEEGLDETLAVNRLRLPKKLERQLSTTNAIENLMGSVRRLSDRVKRWSGGKMGPGCSRAGVYGRGPTRCGADRARIARRPPRTYDSTGRCRDSAPLPA
jgi:hypothetical protein